MLGKASRVPSEREDRIERHAPGHTMVAVHQVGADRSARRCSCWRIAAAFALARVGSLEPVIVHALLTEPLYRMRLVSKGIIR